MQPFLPSVDDSMREHLQKQGLKPHQAQPISDWVNPHSFTYKFINTLIVAGCWFARKRATKIGAPRLLWSTCIVSVPFYWLIATGKLDQQDERQGQRLSLTDRLEYAPVTRRAWQKALQKNNEYQTNLKNEIAELERQLFQKKQTQNA